MLQIAMMRLSRLPPSEIFGQWFVVSLVWTIDNRPGRLCLWFKQVMRNLVAFRFVR